MAMVFEIFNAEGRYGIMKHKKGKLLLIIMLFMSLLLFYSSGIALAADIPLRSFYKTDYRPEDTIKGLDPNVLFLLDTSTAMTFTVDGVMPKYLQNEPDTELKKAERALMLKDNTYGHGMRPPQFNGVETTMINGGLGTLQSESYSRYGRDLDASNNVIGNADCYYTSDPEKPYLLTLRNRFLAHYTGWNNAPPNLSNLPSGGVTGVPTEAEKHEAINSYNAIKEYMPGGSNAGKPVPLELANLHLVPNDSRLYKMKLALWRLTEEQNASVFTRMNVGVAITYQDISTHRSAASMATKNAVQDAKLGFRDYYGATDDFEHGNAPPYITGQANVTLDRGGVPTDYSYMSQRAKRGVLVDMYTNYSPGKDYWNAVSRSILYVPFDKFYVTGTDGVLKESSKLNNFRSYISGYENYTPEYYRDEEGKITGIAGAETEPIKDEFWASSLTLLSTAIYGGRDRSEGGNFPYHKGKTISDSSIGLSPTGRPLIQYATSTINDAGSTKNNVIFLEPSEDLDGLKTGQAIGSVLDFFSPPDTAFSNPNGLDGLMFASNSVGFFPVTGSCQSNWLVVFCSGNDAVPGFTPAEAVKKLFEKTRVMRGRRWNETQKAWIEQNYEMDSGVRTLVVGFLPEEKANEKKEIAQVRNDLKAMAQEGDPMLDALGKYVTNPYAKPEIASDVTGLINAFSSVLRRINAERMGSGAVSVRPVIDNITDPASRVVFGAAYTINPLDQWTGLISKYLLKENSSEKQWEVNEKMIENRLDRNLYTFENASELVQKVNPSLLRDEAGIPASDSQKFNDWLLDYGYGEKISDSAGTVGILGDMVN